MYIPLPEGIYFRLVGHGIQHVLYSRCSPEPQISHHKGPKYEDQLFTLIQGGRGIRTGIFTAGRRERFSFHAPPRNLSWTTAYTKPTTTGTSRMVVCLSCPYLLVTTPGWFYFEEGSGTYTNKFRLMCRVTAVVIFSRTMIDPEFGITTKASICFGLLCICVRRTFKPFHFASHQCLESGRE